VLSTEIDFFTELLHTPLQDLDQSYKHHMNHKCMFTFNLPMQPV
jgi:hypothetical protein